MPTRRDVADDEIPVVAHTVAGDHAPVLRRHFHRLVSFLDFLLRLEHRADDEVHRLPRANRIERRPDGAALVADAMAARAGEFRAAENFAPALGVTLLLHLGDERRDERRIAGRQS